MGQHLDGSHDNVIIESLKGDASLGRVCLLDAEDHVPDVTIALLQGQAPPSLAEHMPGVQLEVLWDKVHSVTSNLVQSYDLSLHVIIICTLHIIYTLIVALSPG